MPFPSKLYAGDTWTLVETFATIDPASELRVHLNSPAFQFTSDKTTSLDGVYTFVIPAALSSNFAPGVYSASITQSVAGARTTLTAGHIVSIEPDPATASSFSYARRMVAALEALIEGRLTNSNALYSSMAWEGRAITQLSPAELQQALKVYRDELKAEELSAEMSKGMGGRKNKIKVYFR